MRECVECGGPIPATKKHNAITCSIPCRAERTRRMNLEKAKAHYARTYVKMSWPARACEQCGAEYEPIRGEQKFCSRRCTHSFHQRKKLGRSDVRPCHKCGAPCPSRPGKAVCDDCRVDPRKSREAWDQVRRLRSYGVTESWYQAQLALQGDKCAICGTSDPASDMKRRMKDNWSIDHDHESGSVRGLLCTRCNLGIGHFFDDPDLLLAAAAYVEQHRTTEQRRTA